MFFKKIFLLELLVELMITFSTFQEGAFISDIAMQSFPSNHIICFNTKKSFELVEEIPKRKGKRYYIIPWKVVVVRSYTH